MPPSAVAVLPPAVLTSFLRRGKLHDYTAGKIAKLRINTETHYRDGEKYQYLTLNCYKVLLYGEGPDHDRNNNHFDLKKIEDKIIVKDSVTDPGKIEIIEYNTYFGRNKMVWIVDPTKIYLRRYEDLYGNFAEEHVYITHLVKTENTRYPGYLTLVNENPA